MIETDTTVQVAVYYGLPDRSDGAAVDHTAGCRADDPLTGSVLIPITLNSSLGERSVQMLDGSLIPRVRVVQ